MKQESQNGAGLSVDFMDNSSSLPGPLIKAKDDKLAQEIGMNLEATNV